MWPDFFPTIETLAIALPTMVVAYAIFGVAGFGAALISAPVLAHVFPVATIVPLLALLDFAASAINGVRLGDRLAKAELAILVPLMAVGSIVGIKLLLVIPPLPMMLALGLFVVGYALYGFFAPPATGTISGKWALLFGSLGGVFSGMFGTGGPLYALYLSRRLADRDAFRATQTTLIGLATVTRGIVFAIAGVYSDGHILALALLLAPAMLLGIWLGHHMTLRLSRDLFLRILYALLIAIGSSLLVRAIPGLLS